MRTLLVGSIVALTAGCAAIRLPPGVVADGVRGPDVAAVVIRTPAEFEGFIRRAQERPGSDRPDGLVGRLEAARPDFDRQVLVLVRHDASSGSSFGLSTAGGRGTLTFEIHTRRQGLTRDMVPYWFAAAADRPGPERIEVRVDGRRQRGPAGAEP
jgi:hypothetical protein